MLLIFQPILESWSNFASTPSGSSLISLLLFVSCLAITLGFFMRILRALKVSWTTCFDLGRALLKKLANLRVSKLPAAQQEQARAQLMALDAKLKEISEVINDAESRLS